MPRNTAASKKGNGDISSLRCHCNPDQNKFSSSSNTPVVVMFPNLCLWRSSLCSNLGGINPQNPIEPGSLPRSYLVKGLSWTWHWSSAVSLVAVSLFLSVSGRYFPGQLHFKRCKVSLSRNRTLKEEGGLEFCLIYHFMVLVDSIFIRLCS